MRAIEFGCDSPEDLDRLVFGLGKLRKVFEPLVPTAGAAADGKGDRLAERRRQVGVKQAMPLGFERLEVLPDRASHELRERMVELGPFIDRARNRLDERAEAARRECRQLSV